MILRPSIRIIYCGIDDHLTPKKRSQLNGAKKVGMCCCMWMCCYKTKIQRENNHDMYPIASIICYIGIVTIYIYLNQLSSYEIEWIWVIIFMLLIPRSVVSCHVPSYVPYVLHFSYFVIVSIKLQKTIVYSTTNPCNNRLI